MTFPGLKSLLGGTTAALCGAENPTGGSRSASNRSAENGTTSGSGSESTGRRQSGDDKVSLSSEVPLLQKLEARDRKVRQDEAAHVAVADQFAGAPTYTCQRGPDGKACAIGGEVSLDIAEVAGVLEATLQKAETIRVAALAPAQPSGQDRKVAARAAGMATEARQEMVAESKSDVENDAQADSVLTGETASDDHSAVTSSFLSTSVSTHRPLDIHACNEDAFLF